MNSFRTVWLAILAIKLIAGTFLPLSYDESYYWVWSKNIQLSYFDHPAMIAWWLGLGAPLESFFHAVRLPAVFLSHLSFLVWAMVLKDHLTEKQLVAWLIVCALSPLVFFSGLIVTPDTPLFLFWALAALFFKRSINSGTPLDYALLGTSLGLGFCSKYNIVIFPIVIFGVLILKEWRSRVSWSKVPLTVFFGLVFSSPVIVWNYWNDFISFGFQLDHGLGEEKWSPVWTTSYILGQIFLLLPTVFFVAIRPSSFKKEPFLFVLGWTPLFFFFLTSFRGLVEANWPLIGYPAIIAIAVKVFSQKLRFSTYALLGIIWTIGISLIIHPWVEVEPIETKKAEVIGPVEAYPYVTRDIPLFAPSYQLAAKIHYETKVPVYKLRGISRVDFYDFQEESVPKGEFLFLSHTDEAHRAARKRYPIHGVVELSMDYSLFRMVAE